MNTTVQLSIPPTPTQSATMYSVTEGRTDRRQYHANSRSYCVQQDVYGLKTLQLNSVFPATFNDVLE